ncbi:MAG: serine/threonine-protein kinase [Eubacteriales bacterium]|nr:serine/threonine-protein kinase [Eubacteriales bacterium]
MDKEMPVSVWPEWKIIEKIGEGSFGRVYKAQRCEQGKTFYSAIKIITIPASQSELNSVRSETADESSAREYFHGLMEECIQEVSTMEHFRGNSHVVSVEDFKVVEYLDEIGWDIYIRMEYLTSFMDYCTEKSLSEMEVIQLGVDLCKALEHCRQLNIIHRDIKPENIFVSRFGEFKIGDFGIARELERTMSGLSKKGTYSYMAPEMYRGEQYDNRVDIYSLGIVLYKLMNHNRLPFVNLEKQLITYRDKENALARRMSGEALSKPADAGEGFSLIILKACAYKPEERYQDASEFRQDLEDLQRGILPQGVIDDLMGVGREPASGSETPVQNVQRTSPENWAAKAWGLPPYTSGKTQENGSGNISNGQAQATQVTKSTAQNSQLQAGRIQKGHTQGGQIYKGSKNTGSKDTAGQRCCPKQRYKHSAEDFYSSKRLSACQAKKKKEDSFPVDGSSYSGGSCCLYYNRGLHKIAVG